MRASRVRGLIVNICVAAASLAVTYLFIEFVVFPRVLPHVPLGRQIDLHEGIRALAQSSKSGTLPRDYVAITGDSYAQGVGDWVRTADQGRNPPYNVTHILYERTGRDAITFGASGAGSLRGIVAEPVTQYEFMKATGRFRIDEPDVMVVYFYEGNDLDDNVRDVAARYHGPGCRPGEPFDERAFAAFIDRTIVDEDPLYRQAVTFRWYDNMFVANFIYRTALRTVKYAINGKEAYVPPLPEWHEGPTNRVVVGGEAVAIPEGLQGPALELTEDEIELGVDVFEQALIYLRGRFADSRIAVLYVPSPLSSYELASSEVTCQTYHGRGDRYPASLVRERSDEIASRVRDVAARAGCPFADARPTIRRAAAERFVHGPLDWRHLNRYGFETLADTVLGLVEECRPTASEEQTR